VPPLALPVAANCEETKLLISAANHLYIAHVVQCIHTLINISIDYTLQNKTKQKHSYGVLLVIAALPLMPGMAQYYYELMEHFAKKFPYMVSTAVLPFKQTNNRNYDIHNLDIFTKNKSLILETHTDSSLGTHPVVEFVESVKRNQRGRDPLFDDRAIIFVVSHNGRYVERRVCPSKEKLELVIEHYLEIQEVKMS
jgi:hypothetical protein